VTAIMRPIILTAIGVAISSVVVAAPASAKDLQSDTFCGGGATAATPVLCVNTVHNGHYVKTITVRIVDGMGPGTVHVRWDDFHRTASISSSRKWNVEDKEGHARDTSKRLRHSDVVCATLDRLLSLGKQVCVGV
jgi:hypothetical protein